MFDGRRPAKPARRLRWNGDRRADRCERPSRMLGLPWYFTFGGLRVDAAVAKELLRAVAPMAIEAAVEPSGGTWKVGVNNSVSRNSSCSRLDMRP